MILETLTIGQVLAPIIAGLAALVLYHYLGREYLGADENKYWNALRVTLLSAGDSTVRQKTGFALTNTAKSEEFVGSYDMTSDELAHTLEAEGYVQCVLSGLKYRPADADPNAADENVSFESGSMAYRESKSSLVPDALALRQVHVFWFENDSGGIEVYAHEEYSSLNPAVAWAHYMGRTQDAAKGIEEARAALRKQGVDIA